MYAYLITKSQRLLCTVLPDCAVWLMLSANPCYV